MNLLNNIKGLVSTPHNHSIIEQYDRDVIKVGNLINGSLHNEIDFPLPRIIVIGTQSSGKSSLLNSIIGFDILPIGKNMVTKSPFSIELINDNNQSVFQIGTYNEGRFTVTKSIQITEYPISKETSSQIEREINLIYKHVVLIKIFQLNLFTHVFIHNMSHIFHLSISRWSYICA